MRLRTSFDNSLGGNGENRGLGSPWRRKKNSLVGVFQSFPRSEETPGLQPESLSDLELGDDFFGEEEAISAAL